MTSTEDFPESPVLTQPNRRVAGSSRTVTIILVVALAAWILWSGARRTASDATQPLMQQPSPFGLKVPPTTLKLASFNIHGGKGMDGIRDLSRTSEILGNVDLAGLYEVRAPIGSSQSNQAKALGQLLKAEWVFAPTERQWWTDHFGNGLLFRTPVRSIVRVPLVNTRGKAFRNAILSTVSLDSGEVRVIAVHIDRENDRQAQLKLILEVFLGLKPPCLIMGDLNTTANDPLLIELRKQEDVHSPLHDSMENGPPDSNIDWIFTRGLTTVSAALIDNSASDHPCLQAELSLNQAQ